MERELRFLLLEDVPTDAQIIEDVLREAGFAFSTRRIETRADYLSALNDFDPDLIIADHTLPSFDAHSAIELAREMKPLVPVIVVTGTLPDERAVELLREGARDYILKDRLSRLAPAARRTLEEARTAAEARALAEALRLSEAKYRRLFEAAKDGVLILDAATGTIQGANPFLVELLGYPESEFVGKKLWEIGAFKDIFATQSAFEAFRTKGYTRCDDVLLETKGGRSLDVEFVSHVYECEGRELVQCNIRDISERRAAEKAIAAQLDELRRFQKVTVEREMRLHELKTENRLLKQRLDAAETAAT